MKRLILVALVAMSLGLAGCASESTDPATMFPNQTAAQLFQHGHQNMLKGHYDDAVQYFESLDARYPFGKYAQKAQLDMIYTYYQNDDVPSAIAAADRYIRLYPRGPNVDYAYYMRGIMQFDENHGAIENYFGVDFAKRDLTGIKKAYFDFERLVKYFPRSKYAADAKQRMIHVRDMIARHEIQTADFYFKRKAYVAAANRANAVVQHYQQTPYVPQALELMVKSYRALNLTTQANNALKVLQINFPDSKALKSLQKK